MRNKATLGKRGSKAPLTDSYVKVYSAEIGAEDVILVAIPR